MKFPVLQRYPDFVIDPPPGPPSQNLYPIAQYLKVTAGHPGSRANQPRGIFEGGGIHPVWGTGGKSQLLGVRMMRDPHPHTMAKSPEKRLNHAASKITGLEKPLQIPGDPSCTVISGGIPGLFRIRQETLSGKIEVIPFHACILAFHGELRHEQPGVRFQEIGLCKGKKPCLRGPDWYFLVHPEPGPHKK